MGFSCSIVRERYSDEFELVLSGTLASLGVEEVIFKKSSAKTPKIIEILKDSEHEFLTRCTSCGENTLKLQLPTVADVDRMALDVRCFDVFYSDRNSPGIRKMMDTVRSVDGITIFEPNSSRNVESLIEGSSHADIVKFSRNRVHRNIAERIKRETNGVKLIISTEGNKGLSFAHRLLNGDMSDWIYTPSVIDGPVIDTSGAGDWLTAGMIYEIFRQYGDNARCELFKDSATIADILSQGMRYSNLCCAAIGAQGVFYSEQSVQAFNRLNSNLINRGLSAAYDDSVDKEGLCPLCLSRF
jgi:fructokinase